MSLVGQTGNTDWEATAASREMEGGDGWKMGMDGRWGWMEDGDGWKVGMGGRWGSRARLAVPTAHTAVCDIHHFAN